MTRMLNKIKRFIPLQSNSLHKGQMGRLGVLGGSEEYTGAPYFSAISMLKCGADLAHIFCPEAASLAIKSYSPEIIVHPTLLTDFQETKKWLTAIHAFVIGPGIGRDVKAIDIISKVFLDFLYYYLQYIESIVQMQKPLIIDADGIFAVMENVNLIKNYQLCVITPNKVEFERLYIKLIGFKPSSANPEMETLELANSLGGVTICRKGFNDIISDVLTCQRIGSVRRCGGQGDLLSGATCCFAYWFTKSHEELKEKGYNPMLYAALAGCELTRESAHRAHSKYGISTLNGNIIEEIGNSFESIFD